MTELEAAKVAELEERLIVVERWIRQHKPRSGETKRLVEDWISKGRGGVPCGETGLRPSQ
jgi:hypothetical protein